jgi:hypothetical protein
MYVCVQVHIERLYYCSNFPSIFSQLEVWTRQKDCFVRLPAQEESYARHGDGM